MLLGSDKKTLRDVAVALSARGIELRSINGRRMFYGFETWVWVPKIFDIDSVVSGDFIERVISRFIEAGAPLDRSLDLGGDP